MPHFDFGPFPVLQTPRLVLREIADDDAGAIFRIRSDFRVTRLNSGAAFTDLHDAHFLIRSMREAYQECREVRWGVTLKNEPDVIGMCGFNGWHHIDRRASIGFDLAQAFWRQGIMGEAVREVVRFGFTEMNLNRIEADASAENAASLALLQSVGFTCEGRQRQQYFQEDENGFHDLVLFGLLRREWRAPLPPRRRRSSKVGGF